MKQFMRQSKKYITAFFSVAIPLVILLLMDIPVYAATGHSGRLRIPFPEAEGFTMIDENGKRSGLVVDYLYEIAKYTGWSYEFIDTDANDMVTADMTSWAAPTIQRRLNHTSLIRIIAAAKPKPFCWPARIMKQ